MVQGGVPAYLQPGLPCPLGPKLFIFYLTNKLAKSGPPDLVQRVLCIRIPRKVNNKGFSFDFDDLDETPKATVLTIVTVVSHNK
jgi:hypothetical protein